MSTLIIRKKRDLIKEVMQMQTASPKKAAPRSPVIQDSIKPAKVPEVLLKQSVVCSDAATIITNKVSMVSAPSRIF